MGVSLHMIHLLNVEGIPLVTGYSISGTTRNVIKNLKKLVPMRRKINNNLGRIVVLLLTCTFYANANFLRAEESFSSNENSWRVSVISKSMATYTAPANVVLTNTGQNISPGFVTQYILVNTISQTIAYTNTTPNFSNVPVGNYSAYAVNYNSAETSPNLTAGTALSAIGGDCVNTSSAVTVIVTPAAAACLSATAGVGTVSAVATGHNTTPGFATTYVLTNAADVIQTSSATGSFPTPTSAGEYRIYAVNYSTTGAQPSLLSGENISAIGGECVDVSATPKCFDITAGPLTCTGVTGGSTISATASGHNTTAGFVTRYVLTNASGVIQSSNTTGSFTAPNVAGEVRIYAVNYSTSGIQPVFTSGTNVSAITGDCVDVSDIPKCFTVTPVSVVCTSVISGSAISATTSGNNTDPGFVTVYLLTNDEGVIQVSNNTGSFTAPAIAGEYRIYAVNYSTSGVAPTLSNGTNINAIGGDCVDLSDNYKCFTVRNCPTNNCITAKVTRVR
jgi:hypothetical protein